MSGSNNLEAKTPHISSIQGRTARWLQTGQGEDVVLLHGWGQTLESFGPLQASLSAKYRVTSFDFPGHGASPAPDVPWGSGEYTEFTRDLLRELNIGQASVIAHSFGARVAIRMASAHPDTIQRLVVVGGAGLRPRRTLAHQVRVAFAKCVKWTLRPFGGPGQRLKERIYSRLGSRDFRSAGSLRGTFVRVVNEDLAPLLPQVKVPTLLIWGELDRETPLAMGERMKALIPGARLIVLKGAGHFAHVEQAERVALEIGRFLRTT